MLHRIGKIPIFIAISYKLILPHAICFNNTIGVLTQDTFPIHFLKWAHVIPEYIELVKGNLQEQSLMNKATRARQPYPKSNVGTPVPAHLTGFSTTLWGQDMRDRFSSSSTIVDRELAHVMEVNEELKTYLEIVEEESNNMEARTKCSLNRSTGSTNGGNEEDD
ncbi:CACTA en-spm transposon protein [Cucumis melo var. makuwa]|uniref:CACTA en-spm transposon protein n=1 Tax=Cucumis melo var. makuwa TaxID=1194695 RepID=A0A5A7TNE4_CUCMM|nr:CACTA en-spm transposon protein [Cucumis melo var. makuwa]